jgi:hypothetical protein
MCAPMFIVVTQLILNNIIRRRMHVDVKIAEEASRLAAESIEHVKTVQALTRQEFFYNAFCSAARRPHRRALTRGLLQALSFAFTSSYTSCNFGIAYSCGMLVSSFQSNFNCRKTQINVMCLADKRQSCYTICRIPSYRGFEHGSILNNSCSHLLSRICPCKSVGRSHV